MPENVQSLMLDILKRIQTDVSGLKTDMVDVKSRLTAIEVRVTGIDGRLERLETTVRKQSRDSAAMLVIMRSTVGVFDERVKALEEDIRLIREQE